MSTSPLLVGTRQRGACGDVAGEQAALEEDPRCSCGDGYSGSVGQESDPPRMIR